FHALFEVVHVEFEEVALVERLLLDLGLARQVAHDAHDERKLDLLPGAVGLDFVFNVNTRRAIFLDEPLPALAGHVPSPRDLALLRGHFWRDFARPIPACLAVVMRYRPRPERFPPSAPGNPCPPNALRVQLETRWGGWAHCACSSRRWRRERAPHLR